MKIINKTLITLIMSLCLVSIIGFKFSTPVCADSGGARDVAKNAAADALNNWWANGELSKEVNNAIIQAQKNGTVPNIGIVDEKVKEHQSEITTAAIYKLIDDTAKQMGKDSLNVIDIGKLTIEVLKDGNKIGEYQNEVAQQFMKDGTTGYEDRLKSTPGKILQDIVSRITTEDKLNQYYKTKDQVLKEAYKAMGFTDIDPSIVSQLFEFKVDDYNTYKASLTADEANYIQNMKLQFGIGLKPTDKALQFAEAFGGNYHTWNEVFKKYGSTNINAMINDANSLKSQIDALLKGGNAVKAVPYGEQGLEGNKGYLEGNGNIDLWTTGANVKIDGGLNGGTGVVYLYDETLIKLLAQFRDKFGVSYYDTNVALDPQIIKFVQQQAPGSVLTELQIKGRSLKDFTFIDHVIFTIYRKDGKYINNFELADAGHLRDLFMQRSGVGDKYIEDIGINYPEVKVDKYGSKVVCTIDFYNTIIDKYPNAYRDKIRDTFEGFDYKKFMPTISFANTADEGIYQVDVEMFGRRYVEMDDTYEYCTTDSDGNESCEQINYWPYYQKPNGSSPALDKRNKTPNVKDYSVSIGKASWEINVGKGTKYTDVPPYGQSDSNLRISDFLNQ